MDKPRVLLVDDEQLSVDLLDGILSNDYETMKAFNGNDALELVEKSLPDIILLDIIMQGMNGYEVCRKLKSNEKTISIPIILISSLSSKPDRIKAIQAGADDFLSKPFDMDILNERIKSLLRIKQYYSYFMSSQSSNSMILANKFKNFIDNMDMESFKNNGYNSCHCTEEIVKSHLEIILLKLLSEKPMCGLDIIKEIFMRYNVLLSQGTVYSILYSLKKDNIIYAEFTKGNMRTKRYSATTEGKMIINRKINEFINTEIDILNSIQNVMVNN